jgi:3-methyladenine DNA glycosylase AlkD
MIKDLIGDLKKLTDVKKAKTLRSFFKTGKGEYGEGDEFWGITVPKTREIARKYKNLPLADLQKLLKSQVHECRLCALMILRFQYEMSRSVPDKFKIVDFYLKNTSYINNWDLVDLSCEYILGNWLLDKDRKILFTLAKSKNLWERRIAIISTFEFIRHNQFTDTLKLSEILINDKHDLIQKAVGWMLREVGKRNEKVLKDFLDKHFQKMPRVTLRYAIERLDKGEKIKYYN